MFSFDFVSTAVERVNLAALAVTSLVPGGMCDVGVVAGEALASLATSEFAAIL